MLVDEWHETSTNINTRPDYDHAYTIDEIYAKAKTDWLIREPATNYLYFETKNKGIISKAGYREKNCADDCFRGVNINEITPTP